MHKFSISGMKTWWLTRQERSILHRRLWFCMYQSTRLEMRIPWLGFILFAPYPIDDKETMNASIG